MNRIAIIGSGIAGLTLAWLARKAGHQVTLFESQPVLGMDAHSIDLTAGSENAATGSVRIDVPPRMFNQEDWPLLTQVYGLASVESQVVDVSKSFATDGSASWLQLGDQYRSGFSSVGSLFSAKARGVAAETSRLQAAVTNESVGQMSSELTLRQYLDRENYSDDFVLDFLFPGLAATVLTCSYESLSNYPARVALRSLLNQIDRSPLRRTTHGTADVVKRLCENIDDVRLSTNVLSVKEAEGSVSVVCADGAECQFEQLVIATQANSAARLLGDDRSAIQLQEILKAFEYEPVSVVVHRDDSFMPDKPSHRKCFNFTSKSDRTDAMCTIWLNRFYPEWSNSENLYQTIRPFRMPAEQLTIAKTAMQRPVVNLESLRAVEELKAFQSTGQRIRFVGSYAAATVPLLESGVASAFEVARAMGINTPERLNSAATA